MEKDENINIKNQNELEAANRFIVPKWGPSNVHSKSRKRR